MARPTGKIIVNLYNNEKILKRKTIYVWGKYRIQLVSAFKVVHLISGAREFLNDVERAVVEFDGVRPDDWIINVIKRYSPIPTDISIVKREVIG